VWAVVDVDDLNVRSGPGPDHDVVGQVDSGAGLLEAAVNYGGAGRPSADASSRIDPPRARATTTAAAADHACGRHAAG